MFADQDGLVDRERFVQSSINCLPQRVAFRVQGFVPVEPDSHSGGKTADVIKNRSDAGEDIVMSEWNSETVHSVVCGRPCLIGQPLS